MKGGHRARPAHRPSWLVCVYGLEWELRLRLRLPGVFARARRIRGRTWGLHFHVYAPVLWYKIDINVSTVRYEHLYYTSHYFYVSRAHGRFRHVRECSSSMSHSWITLSAEGS